MQSSCITYNHRMIVGIVTQDCCGKAAMAAAYNGPVSPYLYSTDRYAFNRQTGYEIVNNRGVAHGRVPEWFLQRRSGMFPIIREWRVFLSLDDQCTVRWFI